MIFIILLEMIFKFSIRLIDSTHFNDFVLNKVA